MTAPEEEKLQGPSVNSIDQEALRCLMDADPYIKKRLTGQTNVALGDNQNRFNSPQEVWNDNAVQFHNGRVTYLDLSGHRIKKLPSEPFQSLTKLETLNLGGTDIPVTQLLAAIQGCMRSLRQLFLGGNGLRNVGFVSLVEGVLSKEINKLQKLDVRYNDIGPQGVVALSKILGKDKCPIEFLYMEGNEIGDEGARALSDCLQNNNACLKEIFLGANRIGVEGARAFAKAIETNKSLTKLYLEGNRIGEEGGAALTAALLTWKGEAPLKKLFVDNNGIGKEQSEQLAKALNSESIIGGVC